MDKKASRRARKLERYAKKRAKQEVGAISAATSSAVESVDRAALPLAYQLSGLPPATEQESVATFGPLGSTAVQHAGIPASGLLDGVDVDAARAIANAEVRDGAALDFLASRRLQKLQSEFYYCSKSEVEAVFRASMGIPDVATSALRIAFGPPKIAVKDPESGSECLPKLITIGGGSQAGGRAESAGRPATGGGISSGAPGMSSADVRECSELAKDLEWMSTGAGVSEQYKRERAVATKLSNEIRVVAQRGGASATGESLASMVARRDREQARAACRIFEQRNELLLDVLGGTLPTEAFGGPPSAGGGSGTFDVPGAPPAASGVGGFGGGTGDRAGDGSGWHLAGAETVRLSRAAGLGALAVDLHGLLPREAAAVVPRVLGLLRAEAGSGGGGVRWVAWIVGTGHHSYLGKEGGSLPPAVRAALDAIGAAYCEPKAVDGKRGGAIMAKL